ncbi:MAG: HAD hydrolase-like protein [Nanoarchaeota archaeon]|nr:HAD hydrolase-like protein [Nanoarchaeota archaeon]
MIKILFFDFDGTINNALNLQYNTLARIIQKHGHFTDKNKIMPLLGLKMQEIIEKLGIRANVGVIRKEFYKELNKGLNQLNLCVSVKPLYALKKDYQLMVISNAEASFTLTAAKKLKVYDLFEKFYTAEHFLDKSTELKKLFKKYKIKPKEAVYIGDRDSDVSFAKKAGCYSIAIHNKCSYSSLSQIKKQKPDFIIKDFYGLERVLKKLNKL